MHGRGTYTWPNGNKYVGEWKYNKRHGQGIYTHADGRVKEGIWENGEFKYAQKVRPTVTAQKPAPYSSKETTTASDLPLCSKTHLILGDWWTVDSNSRYVIQGWNNCVGTYTWGPSSKWKGEKYVGEFKRGKRNGRGTYTWPNGGKYVGEYKDDNSHGQGILYTANGTVLKEGIWENGKFKEGQFVPRYNNARQAEIARQKAEKERQALFTRVNTATQAKQFLTDVQNFVKQQPG